MSSVPEPLLDEFDVEPEIVTSNAAKTGKRRILVDSDDEQRLSLSLAV
jgi:hypothetical protein